MTEKADNPAFFNPYNLNKEVTSVTPGVARELRAWEILKVYQQEHKLAVYDKDTYLQTMEQFAQDQGLTVIQEEEPHGEALLTYLYDDQNHQILWGFTKDDVLAYPEPNNPDQNVTMKGVKMPEGCTPTWRYNPVDEHFYLGAENPDGKW